MSLEEDLWKTMRNYGRWLLIGSLSATLLLIAISLNHPIFAALLAFFNSLGMSMLIFADGVQGNPRTATTFALSGGIIVLIASFFLREKTADTTVLAILPDPGESAPHFSGVVNCLSA
ncbi:hypothetical protein GCM10009720_09260 [Yaniella flava]|uniref:Uncharacterized protein n=1 Tax=Yaniella flava TaxID=287930 RepID=A0ABP5FT87_9MICC